LDGKRPRHSRVDRAMKSVCTSCVENAGVRCAVVEGRHVAGSITGRCGRSSRSVVPEHRMSHARIVLPCDSRTDSHRARGRREGSRGRAERCRGTASPAAAPPPPPPHLRATSSIHRHHTPPHRVRERERQATKETLARLAARSFESTSAPDAPSISFSPFASPCVRAVTAAHSRSHRRPPASPGDLKRASSGQHGYSPTDCRSGIGQSGEFAWIRAN
jgi:hypothetical protein